ncbi:predicted protein [Postia placenta Mad-698-R]|nr:predicted protein [Postia placenta Mad-698-R]
MFNLRTTRRDTKLMKFISARFGCPNLLATVLHCSHSETKELTFPRRTPILIHNNMFTFTDGSTHPWPAGSHARYREVTNEPCGNALSTQQYSIADFQEDQVTCEIATSVALSALAKPRMGHHEQTMPKLELWPILLYSDVVHGVKATGSQSKKNACYSPSCKSAFPPPQKPKGKVSPMDGRVQFSQFAVQDQVQDCHDLRSSDRGKPNKDAGGVRLGLTEAMGQEVETEVPRAAEAGLYTGEDKGRLCTLVRVQLVRAQHADAAPGADKEMSISGI